MRCTLAPSCAETQTGEVARGAGFCWFLGQLRSGVADLVRSMHPQSHVAMRVFPSIVAGLCACACASERGAKPSSAVDAGAGTLAAVAPTANASVGATRAATPSMKPSLAQGGGPNVAAPASAAPKPPACPADMTLVEGDYCPEPILNCLQWTDPPGEYHEYRCAKYAKPTCRSAKRSAMRFCIDKLEYTKPGEKLPLAHQSWTSAKAVCEAKGKRLCMEAEWQFACEGPDMHPYPYGDGLTRDATACNIDKMNLGRANDLIDYREVSGSHPRCVSPFGVYDMSGNIEEWATQETPPDPKDRSTMKGAWWLPGRNTCRARTVGHTEIYEGSQVGVRCCGVAR